ncbi:hypothetical protein Dimus_018997 [Dionaea muscipula]
MDVITHNFLLAVLVFFSSTLLIPSTTAAGRGGGNGLHANFYRFKCPQAERVVSSVVNAALKDYPDVAASLIRLHFHDCFVNGCDASILLDYTPTGEQTEKLSPASFGVRGYEVIDEAKGRLEEECPGIVSCADIIAYAARDAAVVSAFPMYRVPGGRRDGRVSRSKDVEGNIPLPTRDLDQMVRIFLKKNMTQDELVTLLGAHSIGTVHCQMISKNLYNYSNDSPVDPNLDPDYVRQLVSKCPRPAGSKNVPPPDEVVRLNPVGSGDVLDNTFYSNVMTGKAVLPSDQVLYSDTRTRNQVIELANANSYLTWVKKYQRAIVKMGRLGVLTGQNGEIRRTCRVVN